MSFGMDVSKGMIESIANIFGHLCMYCKEFQY